MTQIRIIETNICLAENFTFAQLALLMQNFSMLSFYFHFWKYSSFLNYIIYNELWCWCDYGIVYASPQFELDKLHSILFH